MEVEFGAELASHGKDNEMINVNKDWIQNDGQLLQR